MSESPPVTENRPVTKMPVTKYLQCKLTPEEWSQASEEMADCHKRLCELEDQRTSVNADLKAQSKTVQGRMAHLSNLVREKSEFRDVKCTKVWDWDQKSVEVVRDDTDEIVEMREMTQDELQMPLPDTAKETETPDPAEETEDADDDGDFEPDPGSEPDDEDDEDEDDDDDEDID